MIINVALPIPIFRTFVYKVANYINPIIGTRVLVPFGKKNIIGIITDINVSSKILINNIKHVIYIFDKKSLFTTSLWHMIKWGSQYYHYPIGLALFSVLPKQIKNGQLINNQLQTLVITQLNKITIEKNLLFTKEQKTILNALINQPIYQNIIKFSKKSIKILKILHKKKLCKLYFNTLISKMWYKSYNNFLHEDTIDNNYNLFKNIDNFSVTVISNIKDSDKIKIFLDIIKNTLKYRKQILILVPEVVLIFKLLSSLEDKINFPIGIMYSNLNDKIKFNTWLNIWYNNIPIVIGTKCSLFIPFNKLGLIIVDDEHNILYKANYKWCYNVRDLAILRAKIDNIPIILSSLTPSLETINNIKKNKYRQILINKNYSHNITNLVLVDINYYSQINKLSPILIDKIEIYLKNNSHVLIFVNTLNTKLVLICNICHHIVNCTVCKQYYKYNKYYNKLECDFCNVLVIIPNTCQVCNNKLKFINININNFKKLLSSIFPNTSICNLDYFNNYKDSTINEASVIISNTIFLSKRYYFTKDTLILLMNIDNILLSKNFRYIEYFIQLYNQLTNYVNKKYEVIVQTNFPNHPLIQQLISTNYYNTAKYILNNRKLTKLPPFNFHALIKAINNNRSAKLFLLELKQVLNNVIKNKILIIGPLYSYYFKLRNYFYWYLLLSSKSRNTLHSIISEYYSYISLVSHKYKISWLIDVDPVHY
ncbi:MAG: primosomal protein N' [Candidatus Lightella neohaematopini]|nr:primosomal protein N' [Candidatus Lightella neohaematopini]